MFVKEQRAEWRNALRDEMSDILSTLRNRNINFCTDMLNITNTLVSEIAGLTL
jgi:hypothetical protein